MDEKEMKALAERVTALEDVIGGLAMLGMQLATPAQRLQFGEGVALMARAAERSHMTAQALLLTDVHRALTSA
ncbi:hypothetical protein BH10PSE18_BH10PSE18_15080 [soil metagenome]